MADRFPSIEDIEGGDADVRAEGTGGGDFLERERAALGEDADLFSANDAPKQSATVEDGDDDLLGGGDDFSAPPQPSGQDNDFDGFESSFPAIDTQNDNVGPGGSITNTSGGGYTNYNAQQTEADTEPIRAWREKRDADIARRDEASQSKKEETVATAQKDIDSFYENYNRKIDRQKTQVAKEAEEFLAKREDTTAGGTSWERIAKLVDLSGKGQGGGGEGSSKKRMREMLLSLKNDKEAPAATVA
ncbi:uncharacterized protein HMPREF1541_05642 [Cyphellophora europaea CBS 101466]|uniref:Clathrin light chain n=1 Tax=Cyphellophora europaea (strain CBS 101466) TaxID=1220924 RepID=W2RUQ2_CYPE1|nr:uncharacterized protein HMPREF1541_05642 [Cyphellophora europaea CBS 101466]ETN39419.1 hypothetical protein HMPREF1541_05642 [Cyphellophora europaea CBS 101466]